ncbi:hypothetical protein CARUB_v10028187mg [Capsella rubella]|uniref:F-box domain-containing protein n=1 Tax=Capsella rubella TaxID=81985 RepID=R0EZV4_9BRAS|nr:FBD-associated F-box protein At5g56370 [Capsella rubella]EOA14862.1 hypothetical protein CARUB_v10028187mg [Capsella rubella]
MDWISSLPDDILLKILSSLTTKDVLKTSLLSSRWRNLWKLVHKLEYMDWTGNGDDYARFMLFVDRSLLLNEAPVLESLRFWFISRCNDVDIGFWVRTAVERGLRKFELWPSKFDEPKRLPQSLFTCGTLVVLKLYNVSLEDVKFPVSFPLLKTLHLDCVIYLDDESPRKLFSSCQILEVLLVERVPEDNVTSFSITVPSLLKFNYHNIDSSGGPFALHAPSLKSLEIEDIGHECMIEEMPEIVAANVDVIYCKCDNLLGSLTSLKRLKLCLRSEWLFPTGKIFHQLVDLEFCTCDTKWDLLMCLFKHAPKLRTLKLRKGHIASDTEETIYDWEESRSVPETFVLGLETLEWSNYRGLNTEKEVVMFILKHSTSLKKATFKSTLTTLKKKYGMLGELAALSQVSTSHFVFR